MINLWGVRLLAFVVVVASFIAGPAVAAANEGDCVEVSLRDAGGDWRQVGVVPCAGLERRGHELMTTLSVEGEEYPVRVRVRATYLQPVTVSVEKPGPYRRQVGEGLDLWTTTSRQDKFTATPGYVGFQSFSLKRNPGEIVELPMFVRRFSYEAGPNDPEVYFIPVAEFRVRYL